GPLAIPKLVRRCSSDVSAAGDLNHLGFGFIKLFSEALKNCDPSRIGLAKVRRLWGEGERAIEWGAALMQLSNSNLPEADCRKLYAMSRPAYDDFSDLLVKILRSSRLDFQKAIATPHWERLSQKQSKVERRHRRAKQREIMKIAAWLG